MVYIYVLRLRQGKYYVGKTTSPISRISNHFDTGGSQWTRKYKPVEIIKVDSDCDDADEDKYTLQYMNKYGINNVRGGTFSTIDLDTTTTTIIKRMLDSQNDNCYRCGKTGHITNQCYAKTCVQEYDGDSEEEEYKCYRCGRAGHFADQCYAKTRAPTHQPTHQAAANHKMRRYTVKN